MDPKFAGEEGLLSGEERSTGREGHAMSEEVIAGAVEPLAGGGGDTAVMSAERQCTGCACYAVRRKAARQRSRKDGREGLDVCKSAPSISHIDRSLKLKDVPLPLSFSGTTPIC